MTILLVLILVGTVGFGVTMLQGPSDTDVGPTTAPEKKLEYIQENYHTSGENTSLTAVYIRSSDGNVLSKESLLSSLRYQQQVRENETIADIGDDERPVIGVANIVATRAAGDTDMTLDQQIATLESMSESEVEQVVSGVLAPGSDALQLMPKTYEPGTATAAGRRMVFRFDEPSTRPEITVYRAQEALHDELRETPDESYFLIQGPAGNNILGRINMQILELVGPLALVLVVVALAFTYRDIFDILLGLSGVLLTLLFMLGLVGWLGVPFGPTAILAPILIIGLSIDYGIHIFMRYREERGDSDGIRPPMRVALAGVSSALALVTVTTVIGFLSNVRSPVSQIRHLTVAMSLGVVAAFVVFVTLVPALKVELDGLLERFGIGRTKPALGTTDGTVGELLSGGVKIARVSAAAVILVSVVVGAGGVVAWDSLDRSLEGSLEQPEGWQQDLPEPLRVPQFEYLDDVDYVKQNYLVSRSDYQPSQILVEGDVTGANTLERVADARSVVTDDEVAYERADGSVPTTGPITAMQLVAERNSEFASVFRNADTDGNGVPDRNLEAVYDKFYEVAPDRASAVVERTDGEYRSLRLVIQTDQTAESAAVASVLRDATTTAEGDGAGVTATATGQPVINDVELAIVADSAFTSLMASLAAILALLSLVYRFKEGSATLGVVTTVPIALVIAFVVISMLVIGVPITFNTALMFGLVIGLGVDYSIHISDRFLQEYRPGRTAYDALTETVTGTGGALFGSTVTTAGAFATLALSPFTQSANTGIIVALSLVFSFVTSVFVLPSFLAVWARFVGADLVESSDRTTDAMADK
ncbi:efflux RND transporter permease subunit [Halorussus lipolyticus]|uniref:efflux RND transporter permease subunit n=1 Tax=Halorussus lipolyticus TaxID=3034024 RepID=UPI0023E8C3BE|nr:MMPL family transporter [Halorussus sp. DT80]